MVHNPEQDNQITHQELDPHSDLEKVRPNVLVPDKDGDVSLERREESLLPPEPQTTEDQ